MIFCELRMIIFWMPADFFKDCRWISVKTGADRQWVSKHNFVVLTSNSSFPPPLSTRKRFGRRKFANRYTHHLSHLLLDYNVFPLQMLSSKAKETHNDSLAPCSDSRGVFLASLKIGRWGSSVKLVDDALTPIQGSFRFWRTWSLKSKFWARDWAYS